MFASSHSAADPQVDQGNVRDVAADLLDVEGTHPVHRLPARRILPNHDVPVRIDLTGGKALLGLVFALNPKPFAQLRPSRRGLVPGRLQGVCTGVLLMGTY